MIGNRERLAITDRHVHALDALEAGIEAARPRTVVEESIYLDEAVLEIDGKRFDLDQYEDVVVLGGGNAAGHVAAALESVLGDHLDRGLVVTDDPCETSTVEVHEGTHPLPTAANVDATERLLEAAWELTDEDLVLVCLTGGGSALMCAPADGISLDAYRDVTDQLLRSGAPIDEINALRKHLSAIKGGQLARAIAPAETVGVVLSDVVSNRLDVIASGPTEPDPTTYGDALAIRDRYALDLPAAVDDHLEAGAAGKREETPDASDPLFEQVTNRIVADGRTALKPGARLLAAAGYATVILSAQIEGEAADVGTVHAGIARDCLEYGTPFEPPVAILSGGETTVTVSGDGHGGPNQEFVLSASLSLSDTDAIVAGVDTDGIDGNSDAAGAILDPNAIGERDSAARSALATHNVSPYLDDRNALINTGPTGTNVNDFRVMILGAPAASD